MRGGLISLRDRRARSLAARLVATRAHSEIAGASPTENAGVRESGAMRSELGQLVADLAATEQHLQPGVLLANVIGVCASYRRWSKSPPGSPEDREAALDFYASVDDLASTAGVLTTEEEEG